MKYLLSFLIILMLCVPALAAPTTGAATAIGTNNVTLSMTGAVAPCWFAWGQQTDVMTWRTPNSTPVAGASSYTIKNSPLLGNTVFYFKACDTSGCGNALSFTTPILTPIPTTTYGATFDNLTENGMDISRVGMQSAAPYMWLIPGYEALVWGLIFLGIFLGLWLRARDVLVVSILGLMIGGSVFWSNAGLGLGMPPEFVNISQGLMYASLTGILLSIIKK